MKVLKWIGIVLIGFILLFVAFSLIAGTLPQKGFMSDRMDEIERYFSYRSMANDRISKVDVAWQLDHILKAIINITNTLEESDPQDYYFNINPARTFVFNIGDFPRGVAQAPASVMPPEIITDEALADQLKLARNKMEIIQGLPEKSSFNHSEFGLLDRNEAARLIEVHTDHHLKIVRDILEVEGIEIP